MPSLLQLLGLPRMSPTGPEPTPEVLNQLELLIHSQRVRETGALLLLRKMAAGSDSESVLSTISRMHCAGLRQPHFLTFAVAYCIAHRELDAAYRYAVSLRHDAQATGEALFRLAHVAYLRRSYGMAVSLLTEYLEQVPQSAAGNWYLGLSHLRRGCFRDALQHLRASQRITAADERWLSSVVANGLSGGQADWHGRRKCRSKYDLTDGWRENVLNAPLGYKSRSPKDVDLWINSCRYVPDQRLFGTPDHWQTPSAMEANRMGDCEDFALWSWVQLLRQGVDARFVLGGLFADEINHAWVQIYKSGRVGVFECTPMDVNIAIGAESAYEYRPFISVDKSLTTFVHVPD